VKSKEIVHLKWRVEWRFPEAGESKERGDMEPFINGYEVTVR
jgi:hypothetical protein